MSLLHRVFLRHSKVPGDGRSALAYNVMSVLVMVSTMMPVGGETNFGLAARLFVHQPFDSPAKTTRVVGIDRLEDEKNRSCFEEYDGANECCDAASIENLSVKLGRGRLDRQPYKEALITVVSLDHSQEDQLMSSVHSAPRPRFPR